MAAKGKTETTVEGAEKPKRAPQKRRFWLFYRAVDGNGNPVDGVKVEVYKTATAVADAMEVIDSDRTAQYVKIDLTPKDDDAAA